jgi:GTPase involved in cell partitioning and DNA repair
MKFLDEAKVYVASGAGGNGYVCDFSFKIIGCKATPND